MRGHEPRVCSYQDGDKEIDGGARGLVLDAALPTEPLRPDPLANSLNLAFATVESPTADLRRG